MKYISMWVDQNNNCYDAEGIIKNYGIISIQRWGQGISNGIVFVKNSTAEFLIGKQDLIEEAKNWGDFFQNKKKFKLYLETIEANNKSMTEKMKRLLKIDLTKLSDKELFDEYLDYVLETNKIFNCYVVSQPHRAVLLEKKLKKAIENKCSEVEITFAKIASPKKKLILKDNKFFQNTFAELFKEKIDKSLAENEIYSEEDVDDSERKRLISELGLDEEAKQIADILGTLTHERMKMRLIWMPALYYLELFLIEAGRRHNISKETLKVYDEKELEELIAEGKKIDKKVIDERKIGFLKIFRQGRFETYQGEEAEKMLDNITQKETSKEMSGMIANRGHVVGKAVIFSYKKPEEHAEKMKNMQPGSIIISEMTRPNLVPALEKAVAIVTDEGGITCHASIVAREFNIPTIVGTKIATYSINDGDWVEVDAEQGIVRVLEK